MSEVVSRDGTTIAYEVVGSGPVVVLVGGALQFRAIDPRTAQIAAQLGAWFTVVTYDRRGRGNSDDVGSYSVAREVEDLGAVLEVVGGEGYVFGMSSGGTLALEAAGSLPLSRVALYEPPLATPGGRDPLPVGYLAELRALLAGGRRGDAVAHFMTTAVGVPADIVDGMRAAPFWAAFESVAHTLVHDGELTQVSMTDGAAAIRGWAGVEVPVLVLDGGASPEHQRVGDAALVAGLPSAQLLTLPGQGHDVAPEALVPALVDFLQA